MKPFLSVPINNNVFIPSKILKAIKKALHVHEQQASQQWKLHGLPVSFAFEANILFF